MAIRNDDYEGYPDKHYHVDPVEFGQLIQEIKDIKEAIMGKNGVVEMIKLQNGRVRKLESWRDRILGAITLLTIIFTVVQVLIRS